MKMRTAARFCAAYVCAACAFAATWSTARSQPAVFRVAEAAEEIVNIDRPRIAVAPDGSSAVAFDALVQDEFTSQWQVAVQRFSPSGAEVGTLHLFEPESCGGLDIWSSDFQHNAELAFRTDGVLAVVMQHSGWYSLGGVDDVQSSEITIGAIGADGGVIDLRSDVSVCEQQKLTFVGAGRQDRPRFALLPNNSMLITADGFFQGSDLRNVAVRALGPDLSELIEEVIPHEDALSQQAFHMQPDIATNGSLVLSVWQECPIIDQQGNANECDIGAQFASITQAGLQVVGVNQRVNTGDPVGTLNLYPSAAMNTAGLSVVAWADARTGLQGDIFAQRFDAQGQPVGGNIQVSAGQGVIELRPEVAMLNDGAFMVAWMDSSAGSFRARGRRFNAAGSPLGPPFLLANGQTAETGQPDIVSTGSEYVYIWGSLEGGAPGIFSSNLGAVLANEEGLISSTPALDVYPNPFTSTATIRYDLPEPSVVTLSVYDMLGREVAQFARGHQPSGPHEIRLDGLPLATGTYFIRLQTGARDRTSLLVRTR